jgi:hypothetical protein
MKTYYIYNLWRKYIYKMDYSMSMHQFSPLSGRTIHKRIRKTGSGSWCIPVPKIWGELISEPNGFNRWIELHFINGKLLITPSFKDGYREIGSTYLNFDSEAELVAKTCSAYVSGLDRLKIFNYSDKFDDTLDKLSIKLPGLRISKSDIKPEKTLFFSTPYESFQYMIDDAFSVCQDFYERNKKDMTNFPNISKWDSKTPPYHDLEKRLDQIGFEAKRIMVLLINRPSSFKNVRQEDIRNVLEKFSILSYLERLSDLEEGISRHVRIILKGINESDNIFMSGEYSIINYHDDIFRLVRDAYESNRAIKNGYNIIETKHCKEENNDIWYRNGYVSLDNRIKIIQQINSQHFDPITMWRLNLLEQSIWSMSTIGVKIAEANQNINRPEIEIIPKKT